MRAPNTRVMASAWRSAKKSSSGMAGESGSSHKTDLVALSNLLCRSEAPARGKELGMKSGLRLLLVDDNPADVGLAREALVKCVRQSEITSVEDGMEAMAFLDRRGKYAGATRPDLVILDLRLPKKDGLAVLAAIKARPELRRIP